uniref:Uncharacterized protein n=1 Tax=Rhodnius prolixus TaxID=13249 RepID=T1HMC4_RHOPR
MSASVYGSGFLFSIFLVSGLLKRAWHEIPGVMGSTVMGLLGLGIGTFALCKYDVKRIPKYKMDYIGA